MCHAPDDRPAIRAVGGAASNAGALVLRSSDGTRFDAFFARAENRTGVGMVVLPDNGGLGEFYKELAHRLAACADDTRARTMGGRSLELSYRFDPTVFSTLIAEQIPRMLRGRA